MLEQCSQLWRRGKIVNPLHGYWGGGADTRANSVHGLLQARLHPALDEIGHDAVESVLRKRVRAMAPALSLVVRECVR